MRETKRDDRARERQALARARLQRAMERALQARMQRILQQAATKAAEAARQRREREEIAAAAMLLLLRLSTRRIVIAHIWSVVDAFNRLTLQQIGISPTDAIDADAILATAQADAETWVDQLATRQITEIAETTRRRIINIVSAAEAEVTAQHTVDAEALAETIAERIEESIGGDKAIARATTIAGTITHAAAESASDSTAKATKLQLVKDWASMEDSKVRPTHRSADGQTVGIYQSFLVGGVYLRFPGDPLGPAREIINCRCTQLFRRAALPAPPKG